jgi:hypothetical protein
MKNVGLTSAWSGLAGEQPLFEVEWASRSSATFGGYLLIRAPCSYETYLSTHRNNRPELKR